VGAVEPELVEQCEHAIGEVRSVVGGHQRLVGVAETREVERDHPVAIGQRGDGGQEGGFRRPESVDADHRIAVARGEGGDLAPAGRERVEAKPTVVGDVAGRGKKADSEVEVLAHAELSRAECVHPAANVPRDPPPGVAVGAQQGVGLLLTRPAQDDRVGVKQRVPLAFVFDDQPDQRPAAGNVDHLGIESLQEGGERAGWAVSARLPLFGLDGGHRQSMRHCADVLQTLPA
jgi:hypothetical protein